MSTRWGRKGSTLADPRCSSSPATKCRIVRTEFMAQFPTASHLPVNLEVPTDPENLQKLWAVITSISQWITSLLNAHHEKHFVWANCSVCQHLVNVVRALRDYCWESESKRHNQIPHLPNFFVGIFDVLCCTHHCVRYSVDFLLLQTAKTQKWSLQSRTGTLNGNSAERFGTFQQVPKLTVFGRFPYLFQDLLSEQFLQPGDFHHFPFNLPETNIWFWWTASLTWLTQPQIEQLWLPSSTLDLAITLAVLLEPLWSSVAVAFAAAKSERWFKTEMCQATSVSNNQPPQSIKTGQ